MVRIVLIDDDAVSSFVTEKFIQKNIKQPFKIFKFTSASEALKEIYAIKPSYLFVDLIMPQMTGWDFLENLDEKSMETEIYILSSTVDEQELRKVAFCQKVKKFLPKQTVKHSIEDIFSS
ncbi:MAG TPA: response regulator [Lunatimonas sp.]|nr:response regulator [Lunatimonas sp.]